MLFSARSIHEPCGTVSNDLALLGRVFAFDLYIVSYQICIYLFSKKAKLTEYLDIHMPISPLCYYTATILHLTSPLISFPLLSIHIEMNCMHYALCINFVVPSHLILYVF